MTKANSNIDNATKIMQVISQRSMREKLSETGVFCLAIPEMLISISRVVMRRAILPGSKPGGIKKLKRKSPYLLSFSYHRIIYSILNHNCCTS